MLQRSRRAAGQFGPCLPSPAKAPPTGPDWLNEIKRDGFRILARRDAAGVRLGGLPPPRTIGQFFRADTAACFQ